MNSLRRHEMIMELLLTYKEVTVSDLSGKLNVTGKTVREDLARLEEKGLLLRVHGGAVLAQSDQLGILTQKEQIVRADEKSQIAGAAVQFIEENDIIALDGGSTTLQIARQLENKPLTVVTNDVYIIAELSQKDHIRLVVPGGYRVRNMLTGRDGAEYIRKLNIHKAFITATGIHPDYGLTIYTGDFHEYKRAIIETARTSYVVANHQKFGQSALFTFASLNEVEGIITDTGIADQLVKDYMESGVNIIGAKMKM